MNKNPLLKNNLFLYISEFISGICVMGIEIAANRLISPYLSSSQVVLTLITGIVLIAMATGNFLGGKLSDKYKDVTRLYIMIAIAGVYVLFIPLIGKYVIGFFAILFALFINGGLMIWTTVFSCLILLVPPLLILGMVTPSLIKYSLGNEAKGKIVGLLEALNTTGSILGTFIPTFVTIPFIGTPWTFIIFGGLLIAMAMTFVFAGIVNNIKNKGDNIDDSTQENDKENKPKFALFIRRIITSIAVLTLTAFAFVSTPRVEFSLSQDENTLYEGESLYNYLKVYKEGKTTYLSTNILFGVQSMINDDLSLTGAYYDYALAAPYMSSATDKCDILILGNGSGTYATMSDHYLDYDTSIKGVEIDQKIIDLSYEYFKMPNTINVVCDDGRSYLSRDNNKYDVVMVDAYSSISSPFQMSTVEFFQKVKEHLKDDGVMVVNINMASKETYSVNQALCDTVDYVFGNAYEFDVPYTTNLELFASNGNNLMNNLNNNLNKVSDYNLKRAISRVNNDIELHYSTGIKLYDSSADIEIRSMYTIDGVIMEELSYYREVYKEKGLVGLIQELM